MGLSDIIALLLGAYFPVMYHAAHHFFRFPLPSKVLNGCRKTHLYHHAFSATVALKLAFLSPVLVLERWPSYANCSYECVQAASSTQITSRTRFTSADLCSWFLWFGRTTSFTNYRITGFLLCTRVSAPDFIEHSLSFAQFTTVSEISLVRTAPEIVKISLRIYLLP